MSTSYDEWHAEVRRRIAHQHASTHLQKAPAHFQAGRFNEGMSELAGAARCYMMGEVWERAAEVREEMAEHNLSSPYPMGKGNAVLDYQFAADEWFKHGNALKEKGQIEDSCAAYKRTLVDCARAISLDPRSRGGFLISRDTVEKAITDLKCL